MTAPRLHTMPLVPGTNTIATYQRRGVAYDTGVQLGLQPDGRSWLVLLDLDTHTASQNADAALATLRQRLPARLFDRLAIQPSRGTKGAPGYHLFLTLPFDPGHHPLYLDGVHIGELISSGHTYLDPHWIQRSADTISGFCTAEWDELRAVVQIAGPQFGTSPRKARMAEGLTLIAGWEQIADWHEYRDVMLDPARNKNAATLRQCLNALRRAAPGLDRSNAYSRFTHALMMSAYCLPGVPAAARYRYVAAIAISTGAAGKEHDNDYRIVNDTAVLIARIKHGDALASSTPAQPRRWIVPFWCRDEHTGPAARPPVPAQPQDPRRAPGRPAGSRQKQIDRTLRYLTRHASGDEWRGTIAELASALKVAPRTMSSYLHDLQEAGRLTKGQIGGNGPLVIMLKCSFGHADNSAKACTTDAKTAQNRGADANTKERIPMQQTTETTAQCIKEKETPKIPAPQPDAARPQGAPILGVPLAPQARPVHPIATLGSDAAALAAAARGSFPLDAIRARMAATPAPEPARTPAPAPEPAAPVEAAHDPALCAYYDPSLSELPEPAPDPAARDLHAAQHTLDGRTVAPVIEAESAPPAWAGAYKRLIHRAIAAYSRRQYAMWLRAAIALSHEDFYDLVARHPWQGPKTKAAQQRFKLVSSA
jgi:hypothetical protein